MTLTRQSGEQDTEPLRANRAAVAVQGDCGTGWSLAFQMLNVLAAMSAASLARRKARRRAPNSDMKTNVVLVCFIIASVQVCIQYRIQAALPAFRPILRQRMALGVGGRIQNPAEGVVP
jgi:hypothetical protein